MRYIKRTTKDVERCLRSFNGYYALVREFIEKGILKSSLDRGAFTHPNQILNKEIADLLGSKRHRISIGYGPEAGEEVLRSQIALMENMRHGTSYTADNVAIVAGAWCGVELVLEEIANLSGGNCQKMKVAVIGPTHYQLFQRPIQILGFEVVAFDFVNFAGSVPQTKDEINDILSCKPDVVFVTNPNNPIGEYFPPQLLRFLIEKCVKRNILVIIDEMQNFIPIEGKGLDYDQWIQRKHVIRVDSFSKHYGLAEYRIGWVIADPKYIGDRYNGVVGRIRGMMGNAPRAANDTILRLVNMEIEVIRGGRNPLKRYIDSMAKKEQFIIRYLKRDARVQIIPREGCFNLTISVKGFPNDIVLARKLMEAGTMLMPCEGYGYRSEDTVMRITFAERWKKVMHGMKTLRAVLDENQSQRL